MSLRQSVNHDPVESCSINDYLPNEMLEHIFRKISCSKDICQTRSVCQRWKLLMDEVIGHTELVTSFASFLPQLSDGDKKRIPNQLRDIEVLRECDHVAVRRLTIGVPGMLAVATLTSEKMESLIRMQKHESFPSLRFPYTLQRLACFEPVPVDTLEMLNLLNNLFHLNLSIFSLVSVKSLNIPILLRSLTCLIISEVPTYPEFNSVSVIEKLNSFLRWTKTPALVQFHVSYPISSLMEIDDDSTRHVLNFLMRSSRTIKILSVFIFSPNQNFTPPSKFFLYPQNVIEEMAQVGKQLQLKGMELRDNHLHSLRPSTHVKGWVALIKQQGNLVSLKLELKSSIEFVADVLPILQKNSTTLKDLDFSCFPSEVCGNSRDISFIPVECHYFQICSGLESLRSTDKLINTSNLPRTLRFIKVDALLMNADANDLLLHDYAAVDLIELRDIRGGAPKGFGYGIPISTLKTFAGVRKVRRVVIYAGSTDGQFPKEGIPNGDPITPIYLHKRRPPPPIFLDESGNLITPYEDYERFLSNCVRIDWTLNTRGYYEETASDNRHRTDNIQHSMFTCDNLLGNSFE